MIESKKDNLHICVDKTKLVGSVAVCVSFKAAANACCLNKLKGNCTCDCFPVGSEMACLCYSMYLAVQNALCGDPLATAKSKVGSAACGVNDSSFSITWQVKGTGSAVRKSLGLALKQLAPSKMNSIWQQCMKASGAKPDKLRFLHAAEQLTKSIKAKVHCVIVGNIKTEKALVDTWLPVLLNKLKPVDVSGGKAGTDHKECIHENMTEIKTTGWQSHVVKDYINAKIKGLSISTCDKYLLVNVKPAVWKTASEKIKKAAAEYVSAKYMKVGADLPQIMAFNMITHADVSADNLHSLLHGGIKANDVEKAITGAL